MISTQKPSASRPNLSSDITEASRLNVSSEITEASVLPSIPSIYHWTQLSTEQRRACLQRPSEIDHKSAKQSVLDVLEAVKQAGDVAVMHYTERWDGLKLTPRSWIVSRTELQEAYESLIIQAQLMKPIQSAIDRIRDYHKMTLPLPCIIDTHDGIQCERHYRPIQRVGLYVPGGTAPLISTLMMLAVPALVAGCPDIMLCTAPQPDGLNPVFLATAALCGVKQIYTIGGAQAIAAMAYGTETIPRVDKIFGPGNRWVTLAKQYVAADPQGVQIDLPAGPSELMVIADETADPNFLIYDLLSQAEHDCCAQVSLLTTVPALAEQIQQRLSIIAKTANPVIQSALSRAPMIVVDSIETAINIANAYAPEHLSLQIDHPRTYLSQIQAAGAVFIGPWTAEAMGDYLTGSNHVLPTAGVARSRGGLSILDYLTTLSVQTVERDGLTRWGEMAATLADLEGLMEHANAIRVRLARLDSTSV